MGFGENEQFKIGWRTRSSKGAKDDWWSRQKKERDHRIKESGVVQGRRKEGLVRGSPRKRTSRDYLHNPLWSRVWPWICEHQQGGIDMLGALPNRCRLQLEHSIFQPGTGMCGRLGLATLRFLEHIWLDECDQIRSPISLLRKRGLCLDASSKLVRTVRTQCWFTRGIIHLCTRLDHWGQGAELSSDRWCRRRR